ncbi:MULTISPECIES: hypothetical protein [Streptomyces]|uniref:hypothetical protein n=1 Tax=Streptomyces TaxID=1883 RepID=UPI0007CD57F7|nr:hypothetical protein A4V12_12425 [Streptomyces noursei]
MARMRRGLVHAMAWSLATGAAVTLSWWGVHTVMAGTAYDPPRALPITADRPAATPSVSPRVSSTRRPQASPTPSPPPPPATSPAPGSAPPAAPSRTPSRPAPTTPSTPPASTGEVKSYTVDGGRVAFDIGASSAELVSATPASGWQMQVWKQPTYIRVTFSRDGKEIDVFCTWHDHAPLVQIDER